MAMTHPFYVIFICLAKNRQHKSSKSEHKTTDSQMILYSVSAVRISASCTTNAVDILAVFATWTTILESRQRLLACSFHVCCMSYYLLGRVTVETKFFA
eukprot:6197342-Pleurochrysis_carterae.AAC.2